MVLLSEFDDQVNYSSSAFSLQVFGLGGNDSIITGSGADLLSGGAGNDTLNGNAGRDSLYGGAGDDTYVLTSRTYFSFFQDYVWDSVIEDAGAGIDTVLVSAVDNPRTVVGIDGYTLPDNVENGTVVGTEIFGSFVLVGNALANRLQPGLGQHQLYGLDGDDLFVASNDILGGDTFYGGAGNDTYRFTYLGDTATVVELAGEGIDTVEIVDSYTLPANVENLLISGGTAGRGNELDNYIKSTGLDVNVLQGLAGNDIIESRTTAASLYGDAGSDRLIGSSGADLLDGGTGSDTMEGGRGNDTYIVNSSLDKVVEFASGGVDLVRSSAATYTLALNIEKLTLTGSRAIDGIGNSQANEITGNRAENVLKGYGGADILIGGGGSDSLFGGAGRDRLQGGSGNDRFFFDRPLDAATNVDRIVDFVGADDTIFLDRSIFRGIATSGELSVGAFRNGTSARDTSDRIIYDRATGSIYYDADGTGAAAKILFAIVSPGTFLTNADFVGYI